MDNRRLLPDEFREMVEVMQMPTSTCPLCRFLRMAQYLLEAFDTCLRMDGTVLRWEPPTRPTRCYFPGDNVCRAAPLVESLRSKQGRADVIASEANTTWICQENMHGDLFM